MGSKAYEEEALRKDGEASVLETTLNHNNETIERLKNDIGDVDNTNLSIDAQIEEKQNFISESEVEIEAKKQELKNVTDEMNNLLSSNEEFSKLTVELNQKSLLLHLNFPIAGLNAHRHLHPHRKLNQGKALLIHQLSKEKMTLKKLKSLKKKVMKI